MRRSEGAEPPVTHSRTRKATAISNTSMTALKTELSRLCLPLRMSSGRVPTKRAMTAVTGSRNKSANAVGTSVTAKKTVSSRYSRRS